VRAGLHHTNPQRIPRTHARTHARDHAGSAGPSMPLWTVCRGFLGWSGAKSAEVPRRRGTSAQVLITLNPKPFVWCREQTGGAAALGTGAVTVPCSQRRCAAACGRSAAPRRGHAPQSIQGGRGGPYKEACTRPALIQQDGNPEVVGTDSAHMKGTHSVAESSPRSTSSTTSVKSGEFRITYTMTYTITYTIRSFI
jgi:hypothetical protein